MVVQHIGILWILEDNKHLKFEMDVQVSQWMEKGPWYNTTIFTRLNGQSLEEELKTGRRDRY